VARRCLAAEVPCHAVVGADALPQALFGLASVQEAGTLQELEAAGAALAREWRQSS
jgi:hypothetical protein